jgi:uncharacterized protein YegL
MGNSTELVVILDASGSMERLKQDVIGGFNQLVGAQKEGSGDCVISVVQFSSFGQQKTIVQRKPIKHAAHLTNATYRVSGWTALRDAMGSVIDKVGNRLAETLESERPDNVIIAVITDGEENHSREYSAARIREMVTRQQDEYNWTFIFVGTNQDAVLEGMKLGITEGTTATFYNSPVGTQRAFDGVSGMTTELRASGRRMNSRAFKESVEG